MTRPKWPRYRPHTVWLSLSFLACGTDSHAQVPAVGEPQPPLPAEVVDDLRPQPMQVFELASTQLDVLVFGNIANYARVGATREGPSELIRSQLTHRVDEIDRTCQLRPDQRAKLLLAGRGDIKRFMDRVDEKRKRFEEVRKDRNEYSRFFQEVQPLRNAFNGGLFGAGSLLEKTLRRMLDEEQVAQYEAALRERATYRYVAAVDLLTTKLARAMGLTADQRERLARLIKDETTLPKSMGTQDLNVVSYQATQVPMAKYEAILDDAQMKVLARQLANWKRYELMIKTQGYVPDANPSGKGR